ncbi:MAG: hypothetical protein GF350_08750 [Chitinivibrionales bacterium]|nr:hypothetical protein [Chitinivibrionales bacterium]
MGKIKTIIIFAILSGLTVAQKNSFVDGENQLLAIQPLEWMFNKRNYFAEIFENCRYVNQKECDFSGKQKFIEYAHVELSEWENSRKDLLNAFINGCITVAPYTESNNSILINNEMMVQGLILIAGLYETSGEESAKRAIDVLLRKCSYTMINNKSRILQAKIKKIKNKNNALYELLALTELDNSTRCDLLDNDLLDKKIRARLGDKDAESDLIEKFKNENEYWKKERLVSDLVYIGTDTCLKTLILHFNDSLFDYTEKGCLKESIRCAIIKGLRYYYPDERVLNSEYIEAVKPFQKEEYIEEYIKRFEIWAFKVFGVKPVSQSAKPFLKGICIN